MSKSLEKRLESLEKTDQYLQYAVNNIGNVTPPTLQTVLANGNHAESPDTFSWIDIDLQNVGAGQFYVEHDNNLGQSAQIDCTISGNLFYTVDGTTETGFEQWNALFYMYQKVGANTTNLYFTTPTANTTLNFPAKTAGTYTLATTSDIGLTGYTVATLPSSPVTGQREYVTDSNVTPSGNFGATVTGGGANFAPVIYTGSVWIIA